MNNKRTYTVKWRTETVLERKANGMVAIIQQAVNFLRDMPVDESEEWIEIEVIDNLTEITVFKERKLK